MSETTDNTYVVGGATEDILHTSSMDILYAGPDFKLACRL